MEKIKLDLLLKEALEIIKIMSKAKVQVIINHSYIQSLKINPFNQ
jgi:hypothetical protein